MIQYIKNHASLHNEHEHGQGTPYFSMNYVHIDTPNGTHYQFNVPDLVLGNLPQSRGVYFLLSHNSTRLQKIGMTNGLNGFSSRMKGYRKQFDPNMPGNDASPAFWYRIMTGLNLRQGRGGERAIGDERIDVYFISFTQNRQTDDAFTQLLGITDLSYDPHADLERKLIQWVLNDRTNFQAQPGINGFPPEYPFPLLLDSQNRLRMNQFG